MKVSGVAETVTVTTEAPTVETARTASASTLNQTTIETTPILGRKFEDLLTLTPGVSVVQGPDGDEITFAGQRGVFNNISLDGGDYNNGFFGEQMGGQRAAIDITLDAVKEFQVVATGANAEFGRTGGGVVNVITKSGTNDGAGQPVRLPAARGARPRTRRTASRSPTSTARSSAARSAARSEGPGVLLPGGRGHPREPAAAEPLGADRRTPCPVGAPTIAGERGAHQRQRRLPAARAPELLPDRAAARRRAQPVDHKINNNAVLAKLDWNLEREQQPVGVVQLQLLEEHEPDLRRRRPTATRPTGSRGRRRSAC